MTNELEISQFLGKIETFKKERKIDLSSDQNVSIAVMNLINTEEHLFFSGGKTGKKEYYDLIKDTREIRKNLLKRIIVKYEGEVWCISKHLLASSMRLIEVGTKQLGLGNKDDARDLFEKSHYLYSLFWRLQKMNQTGAVENSSDNLVKKSDNNDELQKRLDKLVQDLVNCCEE